MESRWQLRECFFCPMNKPFARLIMSIKEYSSASEAKCMLEDDMRNGWGASKVLLDNGSVMPLADAVGMSALENDLANSEWAYSADGTRAWVWYPDGSGFDAQIVEVNHNGDIVE